MYESLKDKPQIYGLKPTYVKFETKFVDNNESLKSKLSELPKGAYIFFLFVTIYIYTHNM